MKKIVFIHLPKCGGTSVGKAIRSSFFLPSLFKWNKGIETIYAKPSRNSANIFGEPLGTYRSKLLSYILSVRYNVVVEGHVPFDRKVFETFSKDWNYVTLLRDPVDRWYSEFFYHVKRNAQDFPYNLPTDEYLNTEQARVSGTMYARFFSSQPELYSSFLDYSNVQPKSEDIDWSKLVAASKDNLSDFQLLGLLEDLDSFKSSFKKVFGRKLAIGYKNKNRLHNQNRDTIDPVIHKRVLELCQPDLEIYNWVKASLEKH